jgi:KDO2-lipid IV(A) lauroyltransferase
MPIRKIVLRHWTEYLAFRLAGIIFGSLPIEWASVLSGRLWRHFGPRSLRRHSRALANLARAFPEKSPAEREAIALDMWENLGRTFAESFHLTRLVESDRITIANLDELRALAQSGKGNVFCAAHQANWELTIIGLLRAGHKPASVYQRMTNPHVETRVRRMRERLYPGGLYHKDSATPTQLLRHCKAGGTIALLADQRTFKGPPVPFFGLPAPSTKFPAMTARSLGVPLYAGQIVRHPGVRFTIIVTEIPMPQTEDKNADLVAATASLQAEFERSIRENPSQWLWTHRRWD